MTTIVDAARALRAKKVSSAELTGRALDSIRKLNPKLNAFITVMDASARESAANADRELSSGRDRGPLHGIPIAVKDVFKTRGVRTTCGSRLFENYVPEHDAAVVEKLQDAGAVILGKTNMHELAYGITSANPHFGPVRNPWNTECIPGGSSGGSGSAVASNMAFMAMGTDTGGSIRIPASFCGAVGLKPTYGRVSRYGVLPLDFTLDHMGPLTRTVRDAAICLNAIAGSDPRDDTSSKRPVDDYIPGESVSIRGLRVGMPENFYSERVDPEVSAAMERAFRTAETLGAHIVPIRVPDIQELNVIGRVILLSEASAVMERFVNRRDMFGADVLALLDQGRFIPSTDYINALRLRRIRQHEFRELFRSIDCLFTPATPTPAPRIGQTTLDVDGQQEDVRLASTRFVRAINVLGLPAVSLPCSFSGSGLPLGLQIVGRPFEEALILRAAAALEDAGISPRRDPPNL